MKTLFKISYCVFISSMWFSVGLSVGKHPKYLDHAINAIVIISAIVFAIPVIIGLRNMFIEAKGLIKQLNDTL